MSLAAPRHVALLVLILAASVPSTEARAQPPSPPPNVILIVADDLGWGELGVYGQERIETPSLDALARRGRWFRQAYAAAPVCAPSRCAILTGLTGSHCRVVENARPNTPLGLEDLNLGLVLSSSGYRSAYVGKWGLGGELDDGSPFATLSRPDRLGFDHFVGILDNELATDPFPDAIHRGSERTILPENAGGSAGRWGATELIDAAVAFVEEADAERPFFLFFAPTLPHREYRVPPAANRYRDRGWPEVEAVYASMISELDDEVGRLVRALEERGLTERTLVVFTSDNGPNEQEGHTVAFFDSTRGLRGRKRDLYEGGLRVPLIVAGPRVRSGEEPIDVPVALYDLLPTFAELAGAPPLPGLDGISLVPVLEGRALEPREALTFASEEARAGEEPKASHRVRAGDLALVALRTGGLELYDLRADPFETRDLASERPADVERLRALYDRLSAPRASAPPPRLAVHGCREDEDPAPPTETAPVAWLDFGGGADPLASRILRPGGRLALAGGAGLREGALSLPRSPAGAPTGYGVLAAHPSHAFGTTGMTLRARIRLAERGTEHTERAIVACARPAGRPERFLDWAVLARIGGSGADAGHLGMLFGDPGLGEGRNASEAADRPARQVASALSIDDAEWHELEVRIDPIARELGISLDGTIERIPLPDRADYPSDGPLILGACLDEAGRPEHGLVGEIDDFVLARGVGDVALPLERSGTIELESGTPGPRTARFSIENPIQDGRPGRALSVTLEIDESGPLSVRLEGPRIRRLLPGARSDVVVRIEGRSGDFEHMVRVVAQDEPLGTLAAGTPFTVTIRGRLTQPESAIGALEASLVVLVLLSLAAVSARVRWARARAARRGN